MYDEEKHIREGKAYALALGMVLFSIPGTAALADFYGIQDKRLVVYGCCLFLMSLALWAVRKSEGDSCAVANKQRHQERPVESFAKWHPSYMTRRESPWGLTRSDT
jgi:hypothetical protein